MCKETKISGETNQITLLETKIKVFVISYVLELMNLLRRSAMRDKFELLPEWLRYILSRKNGMTPSDLRFQADENLMILDSLAGEILMTMCDQFHIPRDAAAVAYNHFERVLVAQLRNGTISLKMKEEGKLQICIKMQNLSYLLCFRIESVDCLGDPSASLAFPMLILWFQCHKQIF